MDCVKIPMEFSDVFVMKALLWMKMVATALTSMNVMTHKYVNMEPVSTLMEATIVIVLWAINWLLQAMGAWIQGEALAMLTTLLSMLNMVITQFVGNLWEMMCLSLLAVVLLLVKLGEMTVKR